LCGVEFNDALIPGKMNGRTTREAEEEAYTVSCAERDGHTIAARSHCWFKPAIL
jgi:hypothetical protein